MKYFVNGLLFVLFLVLFGRIDGVIERFDATSVAASAASRIFGVGIDVCVEVCDLGV